MTPPLRSAWQGDFRLNVRDPDRYKKACAGHAGKNLQAQYERWQPRAKYKMHLDPTVDDVKKLAQSCRRTAKVRCRASSSRHCSKWLLISSALP